MGDFVEKALLAADGVAMARGAPFLLEFGDELEAAVGAFGGEPLLFDLLGGLSGQPGHPMAVSAIAVTANTTMVMPRHLHRGKPSSRTHARLVPPPAASQPGPLPPLLLKGCAGVVLTVSETFSVPVTELGFTKQADSGRLDGVAQARAIKAV